MIMNYVNKKNIMVDRYTVWVGGIEVNDCLMPKEEAVELANLYRKKGYKDVHIELLKQKKLFKKKM